MHMVTEAQSAGGAEQAMFGTKICLRRIVPSPPKSAT